MKKLADYKDAEAIELWADLLAPMTSIIADEKVAKTVKSGKPPFIIASEILKTHKKDATEILLRIDPTPIDGLNLIVRIIDIVIEIMNNEEVKGFFSSAEQATTLKEISGSATVNTEA